VNRKTDPKSAVSVGKRNSDFSYSLVSDSKTACGY
jgi:hypothetical protein